MRDFLGRYGSDASWQISSSASILLVVGGVASAFRLSSVDFSGGNIDFAYSRKTKGSQPDIPMTAPSRGSGSFIVLGGW